MYVLTCNVLIVWHMQTCVCTVCGVCVCVACGVCVCVCVCVCVYGMCVYCQEITALGMDLDFPLLISISHIPLSFSMFPSLDFPYAPHKLTQLAVIFHFQS